MLTVRMNIYHQANVTARMQIKVLSLENPEEIIFTASAKQMYDLLCERFNSPAGSVPWQKEAIRGV